jgi:ABC-type polysaccharide/polyol phosphate transport system ATPase subunit
MFERKCRQGGRVASIETFPVGALASAPPFCPRTVSPVTFTSPPVPLDSDCVIEADRLRKVYRIHEHQATSLKEMVTTRLFQPAALRDFVALEGVSLRLRRGMSLGIIGANGSGKSTLLKLIAGIVQPTSGSLRVRGRVASLLELGSGFQLEFTGMENIFLQGGILGLTRGAILDRLPRILEFSGLGHFIHTPVKRYSTGMTVRLGFAIAAFCDADILLLDEVLSVGDGVFQSRCLERIAHLRGEGKTLLFVSHELGQVERVAEQVLWLNAGRVHRMGPAQEILQEYDQAMTSASQTQAPTAPSDTLSATLSPSGRQGTGEILLRRIVLYDRQGRPARQFANGETIRIALELEVREPQPEVQCWFGFANPEGYRVAIHASGNPLCPNIRPVLWKNLPRGIHALEAQMKFPVFPPGHYVLTCGVSSVTRPYHFFDLHLRLYHFGVRPPGETAGDNVVPAAASGSFSEPLMIAPSRWDEPAEDEK